MDKKYLIRFGYSHRYLKAFTKNERGEVDDIETNDELKGELSKL